mgnify:CR=1 FL=1
MRVSNAILWLVLLLPSAARAQDAGRDERLRELSIRLGDEDYATRERAERDLLKEDESAIEPLRAILGRTEDLTAKEGLLRVLHALEIRSIGVRAMVLPREEGTVSDLYLWEPGRETRLTEDAHVESYATWSPDGNRIAFSARTGPDRWTICVMDAAGGSRRELTDESGYCVAPAWSPDGSAIAYMAREGDDDWDVFVIGADGTGGRRLTRRLGFDGYPAWSPDGSRIAFESDRGGTGNIFTVDPDGGDERQITQSPLPTLSRFEWSPDGRRIGFVAGHGPYSWDIFVTDAEGGEPTKLTERSYSHLGFSWSPDGARIAYTTSTATGKFDPALPPEAGLFVAAADGEEPRRLAEDADTISPCFSPDGRWVLYVTVDLRIRAVGIEGAPVLDLARMSVADSAYHYSFRPAVRDR